MRWLAAVLLCVLVGAKTSLAEPPGSYYLRGFVGYTTQALGDVNDDIGIFRSGLAPISTTLDWDDFGGATNFGAEVGYQFSELVSAGIGLGYQKSSVEHLAEVDYDDGSGTITVGALGEDQEIALLDVHATLAYWLPGLSGMHIGGQLGIARGTLDRGEIVDLSASDGTYVIGTGQADADATALSAGIFAGYELAVSPVLGISGRVGYRFCNLGEMEGDYTFIGDSDAGPIYTAVSGPVTDFNGGPMDFDFSGLQVNVGISMRFGSSLN